MPGLADLPRVEMRGRAQWRRWLAANHARAGSVWLVTYKKGSGKPHLPYDEAVEEALCFGWIDSRPAKLDAERSMLLMTPRKPRSAWSALNKKRVAALAAAGRMAPAGLAKVAAAKRDGSWTKLDAVSALVIPDDLRRALDALPDAAARFAAFPPSSRRAILEWIDAAKRAETRARRVHETARLARRGLRANFPEAAGV